MCPFLYPCYKSFLCITHTPHSPLLACGYKRIQSILSFTISILSPYFWRCSPLRLLRFQSEMYKDNQWEASRCSYLGQLAANTINCHPRCQRQGLSLLHVFLSFSFFLTSHISKEERAKHIKTAAIKSYNMSAVVSDWSGPDGSEVHACGAGHWSPAWTSVTGYPAGKTNQHSFALRPESSKLDEIASLVNVTRTHCSWLVLLICHLRWRSSDWGFHTIGLRTSSSCSQGDKVEP